VWFVRVLPLPLLNIMINISAAFLVKKLKLSNIQIVFLKKVLVQRYKMGKLLSSGCEPNTKLWMSDR